MAETSSYALETDPQFTSAYLYGFGVNGADLAEAHKKWISAALIIPAKLGAQAGLKDNWRIWLCGQPVEPARKKRTENSPCVV